MNYGHLGKTKKAVEKDKVLNERFSRKEKKILISIATSHKKSSKITC